jgi:hypothetical protein
MPDRTVQWDAMNEPKVQKDRPSVGQTFFKVFLVFIVGAGLSILLAWPVVMNFTKIQEIALRFKPKAELNATAARIGLGNLTVYKASLDKDLAGIQKKLSVFQPKGPYLIINTSANNFRLMDEEKVLREGMCSTGSYTILQAGENKQWIFKTPRGCLKF